MWADGGCPSNTRKTESKLEKKEEKSKFTRFSTAW